MRHHHYTQMGRELARRHVDIQHTPEQCRFLRLLISSDPIQKQLDLSEFYSSLRNKLDLSDNKAAMVLENYQADYSDNEGDFYAKYHHSAFLVLKLVGTDDYDGRDNILDECERIGEELMGALLAQLTTAGLRITPDDVMQEAIGPIGDGLVGCRFNYVFRSAATQALTYKPSQFID
jgi:hypothetical protein